MSYNAKLENFFTTNKIKAEESSIIVLFILLSNSN